MRALSYRFRCPPPLFSLNVRGIALLFSSGIDPVLDTGDGLLRILRVPFLYASFFAEDRNRPVRTSGR